MRNRKTPKEMKAQAQRIFFRLVGHRVRWDQIVASVTSVLLSGKLAFNARAILKTEAAEVAAQNKAEIEMVQIVPLTPAEEAVIKIPNVPGPTYSNTPSGTYDHQNYYDMYKYHPTPNEPAKPLDFPND